MPGASTPQLLSYATVVDVDMDQTNDVNFADVEDYGHRVVIEMDKTAMNDYLGWERAIGAARPSAKLDATKEAAFKTALEASLSGSYVDIDGVTGGLHFGSANLDTNSDQRLRADNVTANDIALCFVLYKLYGNSAVQTLDNIFNLQDAHGMLENGTVATAIVNSFKSSEAGALDTMFRDLLAADPQRFFNSAGVPETGIFETRTDVAGAGRWKIVANDTLETKLKLIFNSTVSRRGVAGREHLLSASNSAENQQAIINPGDYFYIRLQIKAVDASAPPINAPAAPTGLTLIESSKSGLKIAFTAGSDGGSAITNYKYSLNGGDYVAFNPPMTAPPAIISALASGTQYIVRLKAVNAVNDGDPSEPLTVNTVAVTGAAAPTNLSASVVNGDISVSFTQESVTNLVYSYSLNNGAGTFFDPMKTASPIVFPNSTFAFENGQTYTIKLRAWVADNLSQYSAYSETVSIVYTSSGASNESTSIETISGLLARYKTTSLDPDTGLWADDSANGRNATLTSGTAFLQNGGVAFDGTTYYSMNVPVSGSTGFTVIMVAQRWDSGDNANSYILNPTNTGFPTFIDDFVDNTLEVFGAANPRTELKTPLNDATYVAAFSFKNDTTFKAYYNNTLVTDTQPTGSASTGSYTQIGRAFTNNPEESFTGFMYDLIFYNRVLTSTEMTTVYNQLAGLYTIGEGSGGGGGSSATAPAAPTNVSATLTNGNIEVTFTPGSDGGSAITNYFYSLNGGSSYTAFSPAQTTSPLTISASGLPNGTYTVVLKALNAVGSSDASNSSPITISSGSSNIGGAVKGGVATATMNTTGATWIESLSNQDDYAAYIPTTADFPFNFYGTDYGSANPVGIFWNTNSVIGFGQLDSSFAYEATAGRAILAGHTDRKTNIFFYTPVQTSGDYRILKMIIYMANSYGDASLNVDDRAQAPGQKEIRLIKNVVTGAQYVEFRIFKGSGGANGGTMTTDTTNGWNITDGVSFKGTFGPLFSGSYPADNSSFVLISNSNGDTWAFENNAYIDV